MAALTTFTDVPDDVLSLIFAEAVIDDPRWTEELAGVCRRFYEPARYLSVKRILIHDFHHSSHSPEAAVRRFSGAGHQNDGLAARELHWCADFLRPEALWRVMALLPNVDRLCLRRVRLNEPVDWFPISALRGLDLVDCTLSFAVLDCLLQAVPNVLRLAVHGGETEFVPSTDEPAEEEPSLHHLPQALSALHLDTRQALNADRGGQWFVSAGNLQQLTLGMTGDRGWWSGVDIIDASAASLQVLTLALNHLGEFWDINLDLYDCEALEHVTLSLAITEDGDELLYLWRALSHLDSQRLQSVKVHIHLLSGHFEFQVLSDVEMRLRDIDALLVRRLGGKAGAEVCVHLHFYLRTGHDETARALWNCFQGLAGDRAVLLVEAITRHEYVMESIEAV
ncbi:uncharacterized protein ARMOST_17729 [Armillaria ostoyae]|uniref:F-box domain-containing protein n=1 Tax=Armillaria ostoyae TaxID=47428 RepID=A0A284RZS7_ARMOS|nr:uncharacterized protein ARMOST_17729 [Armillaria ostoyae]